MAIRTIVRLTPAKPKAGENFKLQVVAQHPNEPGTRRDAEGKIIPAKYINQVEIYFLRVLPHISTPAILRSTRLRIRLCTSRMRWTRATKPQYDRTSIR
ncbi:MAG: thiosulfate oxidation carrier complex protein SoxZ [Thermus sp.]|uniref:thiosulfate oxidation carrier complex protein SoxZ n=1 Tax=Thermus sp. TaxID=275 RepID=UPI00351ADCB0